MDRTPRRFTALCLAMLLAGEPGAAVFTPAALPANPALLHPLPPAALTPPSVPKAAQVRAAPAPAPAASAAPAPAAAPAEGAQSRILVTPPPAFALPDPEPEPATPSPLPGGRPRRRAWRPTPRLVASRGNAADLTRQGERDGFRTLSVRSSEGFVVQAAPMPDSDPMRAAHGGVVSTRSWQEKVTRDRSVTMTEVTYADGTKEVRADPLVIDLDGDGLRTTTKRTLFDIDADGRRDSVNDIAKGDALLVFDADGDGKPGTDGTEVFGDKTRLDGWDGERPRDGFAALEAAVMLAVKDGLLPERVLFSRRLSRADLGALEDSWGLRLRVGGLNGRLARLTESGVVGLDLASGGTRHEDYDGLGNDLTAADGARALMADGSTRAYGELWLRKKTGTLAPLAR